MRQRAVLCAMQGTVLCLNALYSREKAVILRHKTMAGIPLPLFALYQYNDVISCCQPRPAHGRCTYRTPYTSCAANGAHRISGTQQAPESQASSEKTASYPFSPLTPCFLEPPSRTPPVVNYPKAVPERQALNRSPFYRSTAHHLNRNRIFHKDRHSPRGKKAAHPYPRQTQSR